MTPSIAFIGLVCSIAGSGAPTDSVAVANFSDSERVQAEQLISSGACLPENLEMLLRSTGEQVRDGKLRGFENGSPTEATF